MAEPPIIIKKVVKKGGHGHHGGAWKLAYADFVTAMMAFFLLMWLLGSVDEKTRKGISEYFQDPYRATKVDKGLVPSLDEKNPTELDKQADKEAQTQLENLRIKIERIIKMNDKLDKMRDQVKLTITPEGLRIQIVDDKKTPMFKSGSAEAAPHIKEILHELAPVINQLPNKITINGHTDSKPFPDVSKKYTNWELSGERANAARFELTNAGYDEKKILRVSGLSDSVPYNAKDALDPMNRRISIIVMNKKSELQLLEEVGNKINALKDAKPAEGGAAPSAEGGHGEAPKPGDGETAPAAPAAEGSHGEAPAAAEGEHQSESPPAPASDAGEAKPAAEADAGGGHGEAAKTPEAPAEQTPSAAEAAEPPPAEAPKAAEGEAAPAAPAEPAAAPAAEATEPPPAEAPPAEEHH